MFGSPTQLSKILRDLKNIQLFGILSNLLTFSHLFQGHTARGKSVCIYHPPKQRHLHMILREIRAEWCEHRPLEQRVRRSQKHKSARSGRLRCRQIKDRLWPCFRHFLQTFQIPGWFFAPLSSSKRSNSGTEVCLQDWPHQGRLWRLEAFETGKNNG